MTIEHFSFTNKWKLLWKFLKIRNKTTIFINTEDINWYRDAKGRIDAFPFKKKSVSITKNNKEAVIMVPRNAVFITMDLFKLLEDKLVKHNNNVVNATGEKVGYVSEYFGIEFAMLNCSDCHGWPYHLDITAKELTCYLILENLKGDK